MSTTEWVLAGLFLLVAALYSSVGHAGASGYLAAMALLGFAPEQMRPTALVLNLLVGGIGLIRFARARYVLWRNVFRLVPASAPAAFLAARQQLPRESYDLLLGVLLLLMALAVFHSARNAERADRAAATRPIGWLPALTIGAGIGTLSGLTGTGGAIFLTPLLLLTGWAGTRDAAGTSVAFVWITSALALAGLWSVSATLPAALPWWLVAVALGALIGTQFGLHWLPVRALRYALSLVLLIAAGKLLFG